MIITCEQCATQFQLDDARIPAAGVRVRCSRCKHRFFVKVGAPAGDDRVDRMVAQTLAQEPASDPDADTMDRGLAPPAAAASAAAPVEEAADTGGESAAESAADTAADSLAESAADPWSESAADSGDDLLADGVAGRGDDSLADGAADTGEDLFSGSEDGFLAGDASEAPADPFGGLGEEPSADAADDAEADLLGGGAGETPDDPLAESASDWKFDHDAPFLDGGAGEEEVSEHDAAREAVDDLLGPAVPHVPVGAEPLADTDPGVDDDLDALLGGAAPAAQDAAPVARSEDLGSPDSWDFLSEEEPEPSHVAAPAPVLARSAADHPFAYALPPIDVRAAESPAALRWLSRGASALGWTATAALSLLVLAAAVGPARPGRTQGPAGAVASVAGLEAYDLRARWVENAVQGDLLVVSGRLRAAGDAPAPAGTRLALRLLDADGRVLVERASPLASPLPEAVLREQGPGALHDRLQAGAQALARQAIPSHDGPPFEAVVGSAPPRAARFDLVALSDDAARAAGTGLLREPPPAAAPASP